MGTESGKETTRNATPGPAGPAEPAAAGRRDVQVTAGVLAALGLAYILFGMHIKGAIILLVSAGCVGTLYMASRKGARKKPSKSRTGRRSRKKRRRR